jgi:DNA helicase-2/ATP-dependent DNA helicase PcrA
MLIPFEKLDPKQQKILKHQTGCLLVLAGPGTGKTEVLTQRIVYLITKAKEPTDKILAITFSRKAAKEMMERVNKSLELENEQLRISTLHAEALRLLSDTGKGRKFLVADDETRLLIKDVAEDLGIETNARMLNSLERKIRILKANNKFPDEINDVLVKKFYQRYEELLDFNNAIDLDGLVQKVVKAFSGGIKLFSNNQVRHLLVDEYQDINHAEYEFVKILAERAESLFVVGDDDQSIYGWRGADPNIIRDFKKDFKEGLVETLNISHRCPRHILKGAYAIVSKDPKSIKKSLDSSKGDGSPIHVLFSKSWTVEAFWITNWIKEYLSKSDAKPNHIAILAKTLNLSDFLVEQLRYSGIPIVYWRSGGLFSDKNVLDILAHIRLIADKEDNFALRRCLATLTGSGIGDVAERKLRLIAEKHKCCMWEVMSNVRRFRELKRWFSSIESFVAHIKSIKTDSSEFHPGDIVQLIAKKLGVDKLISVKRLQDFAKSLPDDACMKDFLNEIDKNRGIDLAEGGPEPEVEEEAVSVMTLHSAKGLGFEIVFILGMDDKILPDLNQEEYEQRRLCYVAMTRAKRELFLCHAKARKGPAAFGLSFYKPSRFLLDIPKEHREIINNEYA